MAGNDTPDSRCPLCTGEGGTPVARTGNWRVVLAAEPDYPAFTRVIWSAHVAEMSELGAADRDELMRVVLAVEETQRAVLAPDKVNLACFGNVVPHLHWHVVPRWRDDRHFPEPVWGRAAGGRDAAVEARRARVAARLPSYLDALERRLAPGA
ncbi:MAG: HIT family protein [Burkholderiaceae bacterium]|nr:HIT family protein [Burkholderiaceae bacterium]